MARPLPRSIFLGQHDRENARCLRGVGGVFGAVFASRVVVVDLPKNALALVFEAPEIMLAVRVVVLGEAVEGANLLQDRVAVVAAESENSVCDVALAVRRKVAPESVVEFPNFRGVESWSWSAPSFVGCWVASADATLASPRVEVATASAFAGNRKAMASAAFSATPSVFLGGRRLRAREAKPLRKQAASAATERRVKDRTLGAETLRGSVRLRIEPDRAPLRGARPKPDSLRASENAAGGGQDARLFQGALRGVYGRLETRRR